MYFNNIHKKVDMLVKKAKHFLSQALDLWNFVLLVLQFSRYLYEQAYYQCL